MQPTFYAYMEDVACRLRWLQTRSAVSAQVYPGDQYLILTSGSIATRDVFVVCKHEMQGVLGKFKRHLDPSKSKMGGRAFIFQATLPLN